ncbi:MAG TPA: hypothetical protein VFO88_06530 [Gaiellaceae bacterium]|nr:hypothetical protein [Gaiellaceae bacterium]
MARRTRIGAVAAVLAAIGAATALATPGGGITDVVNFVSADSGKRIVAHDAGIHLVTTRPTTAFMQTATLQPGGTSGWHGHRGLVVLAVESGALTRYDGHCRAKQFPAGSYFVEGGAHPVLIRNEGAVPARFYITYLMPANDPTRRIDLPNPGCPVE